MKSSMAIGLFFSTAAAMTCPGHEYYSPNMDICMPKKGSGEYCNVIQVCAGQMMCPLGTMKCVVPADRVYPMLPAFTPTDTTDYPEHHFVADDVNIKSACSTYGSVDSCNSITVDDQRHERQFHLNWEFDYPAYVYPDDTVVRWAPGPATDAPLSSYFASLGLDVPFAKPFNNQLFRNDPSGSFTYNSSGNNGPGQSQRLDRLFEQEMFGQLYELDEATMEPKLDGPNILASYARVISADTMGVSYSPEVGLAELPGPACFSPPTDGKCPMRLNWPAGGAKITKALVDNQRVVYPAGMKYRFTEVFDFTGTHDDLWKLATINGKYIHSLPEDTPISIASLRVPMNLEGASGYEVARGDNSVFELDYHYQQFETIGWLDAYAQNNEFHAVIRGHQILVASYEDISSGDTPFASYGFDPSYGAMTYETRMYPMVVSLGVNDTFTFDDKTSTRSDGPKNGLAGLGEQVSRAYADLGLEMPVKP